MYDYLFNKVNDNLSTHKMDSLIESYTVNNGDNLAHNKLENISRMLNNTQMGNEPSLGDIY